MRTVFKYPLETKVGDAFRQTVEMPQGARVVHVAEQYGHIAIWAEVDTDRETEPRHFWIVGTGRPIPNVDLKHLGSLVMFQGTVVGHVYTE